MSYYFYKMVISNSSYGKQWNKKDLESAITAVSIKEMGFLKAGIPHSILPTHFLKWWNSKCLITMNILKLMIWSVPITKKICSRIVSK